MSKTGSMKWNGADADTIHLETIILVAELAVVVVDLLAMNTEEVVADEDEVIAQLPKGPLRHKEAKATIRRIVVVPTGGVTVATALLRKEANEIRAKEVQKDKEDVDLEVIAAVKDLNSRSRFGREQIWCDKIGFYGLYSFLILVNGNFI